MHAQEVHARARAGGFFRRQAWHCRRKRQEEAAHAELERMLATFKREKVRDDVTKGHGAQPSAMHAMWKAAGEASCRIEQWPGVGCGRYRRQGSM